MVVFNEDEQKKELRKLHQHEEERLIKILSEKYNIPYLNIDEGLINVASLSFLKEKESRESEVVVFNSKITPRAKKLFVGFFSPSKPKTIQKLKELEEKGFSLEKHMVSHNSLNRVWEHYDEISLAEVTVAGVLSISASKIESQVGKIKKIKDVSEAIKKTVSKKAQHNMSKILKILYFGALISRTSDIHIEPKKDSVRIRYRIDGVLIRVMDIDFDTYHLLSSRIKLLSGLKLNKKKDSQDGRFSVVFKEKETEIRTSVLPCNNGESIVMRILDPGLISMELEKLGLRPQLLKTLQRIMKKPNGMILNTGPTGSGKSTTLYALLKSILTEEIKIITIEDPIEYHIDGLVQTQVNPKSNFTFLSGLRASLRQDPDVIMIGEIRDTETAKIAINSALTGHLVLSTLHTNNAAGTIPRLLDLGINPKVMAAALVVFMAQRLVRLLCPHCKKKIKSSKDNKKILDIVLKNCKVKEPDLVFDTSEIFTSAEDGCDKCNGTGYHGRIAIYEAILMDEAIEKLIITNPSEREILEASIPQGILDMREDGVIKVLQGITSIEELERRIDLYKDIKIV